MHKGNGREGWKMIKGCEWEDGLQHGIVAIDFDGKKSVEYVTSLEPIKGPLDAVMLLRKKFLAGLDVECQLLLGLDDNDKPVEGKLLTYGSKYGCIVFDRTPMAQYMVSSKCKKFIFIHNHLSGNVTPSQDDLRCVGMLSELGYLINKQIEDSIIVSVERNRYYSMREEKVFERIDNDTFLHLKQMEEDYFHNRKSPWEGEKKEYKELDSDMAVTLTLEEAKLLEEIMKKIERKKNIKKNNEMEGMQKSTENSRAGHENIIDYQFVKKNTR